MALGAYQSEYSRGNVLNAIAHPNVVDPAGAILRGTQAANSIAELRLNQQMFGIRQQTQNLQRLNYSAGVMADLLNQDGPISRDQVNAALQAHVNDGVYDQNTVDSVASGMPTNTTDMRGWIRQHQIANLGQQQQIMAGWNPRAFDLGGRVVTQNVPTMPGPGGAGAGPSVDLSTTASPNAVLSMPGIEYPATEDDVKAGRATSIGQTVRMSGPEVVTRFGYGGILPPNARMVQPPSGGGGAAPPGSTGTGGPQYQGKPVSGSNPPRLLPAGPNAGTGSGQGGATNTNTSDGTTSSGGTPMNAPTASVNPLAGSVQVASTNPLTAPVVGAAAPASPAVAGDVNAILAGVQRARAAQAATPAGSQPQLAYNTIATGPGIQEKSQWDASAARLAQDDQMVANFPQTQFPATQALSKLGEGAVTGPGTETINTMKDFIRARLQGWGVPDSMIGDLSDSTARYQAIQKWLSNIITTQPFAAGSDARMAQVLHGSANTSINQIAAEDMLKAGVVLQRMGVAANNQWHAMTPEQQAQYGGLYLNYLRSYANTVDPRAFGTDMYNPKQIENLRKALQSGSEADAKRFNDSRAIAGQVPGQQALP